MDRVEGLKKIRTPEEYSEAKARLENYLKQYKWITEDDKPFEAIRDTLLKCIETRKLYEGEEKDPEVDAETQRANEGEILSLKSQYESIKNNTYQAELRRNITALYVAIGDYEARIETRGKKKFSKDAVPDKENVPQDMFTSRSMRRFRFWLANLTGMVPGEVTMNVETRKDVAEYILTNYDLINIKAELDMAQEAEAGVEPQSEETALVPLEQSNNSFYNKLIAPHVEAFIASYGIVENIIPSDRSEHAENEVLPKGENVPQQSGNTRSPKTPHHDTVKGQLDVGEKERD